MTVKAKVEPVEVSVRIDCDMVILQLLMEQQDHCQLAYQCVLILDFVGTQGQPGVTVPYVGTQGQPGVT